jgi:hypothetical protein
VPQHNTDSNFMTSVINIPLTSSKKVFAKTLIVEEPQGTQSREISKTYHESSPSPSSNSGQKVVYYLDEDTTERVLNANRRTIEFLQDLVNEPSIGLFHVNTHIQRSGPRLVNIKKQLKKDMHLLDDLTYDVDSNLVVVRSLHSLGSFSKIKALLHDSTNFINEIIQKRLSCGKDGESKSLPQSSSSDAVAKQTSSTPQYPSSSQPDRDHSVTENATEQTTDIPNQSSISQVSNENIHFEKVTTASNGAQATEQQAVEAQKSELLPTTEIKNLAKNKSMNAQFDELKPKIFQ